MRKHQDEHLTKSRYTGLKVAGTVCFTILLILGSVSQAWAWTISSITQTFVPYPTDKPYTNAVLTRRCLNANIHWLTSERLSPVAEQWGPWRYGALNGCVGHYSIINWSWPSDSIWKVCVGASDSDPGSDAGLYNHPNNRCQKVWRNSTGIEYVEIFNIYGRIVNANGTPIGGATVSLSNGMNAVSDGNGYYEFNNVNAGSHTLTPSMAGHVFSPSSLAVSGGPPYHVTEQNFTGISIPAAPSNLGAVGVSASQINLNWNDNSNNEDGFKIERSPDGSSWGQIATVGANATTFQDGGLPCGTQYHYRVRAYNTAWDSSYSNTAATTTVPCIPGTPNNLSATTISASQINLGWNDNSYNEDGFRIERSLTGSNWAQIAATSANVTAYQDNGLTCSTTYYYQVYSYNAGGNSGYSNPASARTIPCVPGGPSNLSGATISANQINLSWSDNSNDEDGFSIEHSSDGVNWVQIGTVGANVTTFQNTDLICGTTHYYRINAYNAGGNSAYSNTIQAITIPCSPILEPISNDDTNGDYAVSWVAVAGASRYLVEEADNSEFTGSAVHDVANSVMLQISGQVPGRWYYRVKAANSSGESPWSNAQVTSVAPASPILNSIVNPERSGQYQITWDSVVEADVYLLQESTDPGFSDPEVRYVGAGLQTVVNAQIGGTWYYRVRAETAGVPSAWSMPVVTIVGDDFELDDDCMIGGVVAPNSVSQNRTFHRVADADWIRFPANLGHTYVIETSVIEGNADTVLELFDNCTGSPQASAGDTFGPGARLLWTASATSTLYLRVSNSNSDIGIPASYHLTVREQSGNGIAIVVAGQKNSHDSLAANINYAANMAYRTFTLGGLRLDHIYYLNHTPQDANGDGQNDVNAASTLDNLEYAITTWAAQYVDSQTPLYLYFVDHGASDVFMLDRDQLLNTQQLHAWLNALELSTGLNRTVVIVEACRSGSFIENPQTISKAGRVLITSTGSRNNAFPSAQGAHFSDAFFTALGQSKNLYTSFQQGKASVRATGLDQTPWLDDNGDGVADAHDGEAAQTLGLANFFGDEEPTILSATVQFMGEGVGVIMAEIRDDIGIHDGHVWAELYAPTFSPPAPGDDFETPVLNIPHIPLSDLDGDHIYTTIYTGFQEAGIYRVVIYAENFSENRAVPREIVFRTGWSVYLPSILR